MATPSGAFDPSAFDPGVFDTDGAFEPSVDEGAGGAFDPGAFDPGAFDTGGVFTHPVPDRLRRCYTCAWVGRIDLTNAVYDRDGNPDVERCPADGSVLRPRRRAEPPLGPLREVYEFSVYDL